MAHELETRNGMAQMAYVGQVPWHGLGTQLDDNATPQEMMQAAGLDWTVSKHDMLVELPDGKQVKSPDQMALLRDDDNAWLTTVGKGWEPVQNHEAFGFFDSFVRDGHMKMETAGSLFDGKHIWALAKMESGFEILGGDRTEGYFLFMNPHVYGAAIQLQFTPVRVVCNNTLSYAMNTARADKTMRIGHRNPFDGDMVKEAMGLASHQLEGLKAKAEFLASKRTSEDTMKQYFADLMPKAGATLSKVVDTDAEAKQQQEELALSRNGKRLLELVDTQPGAKFGEGSWWQAFNAVTYFMDHEQGRDESRRFYNNQFGYQVALKQKALRSAIEYAEAA